ncbi:MAG: FixH family protein [Gammaproteobacteria bacterium]
MWLIILLPLSAVVGGIVTAWYAVESNDGLVVDDYYKRGLAINKVLDRDRAAKRYGLVATLQLRTGSPVATVILKGNSTFTAPEEITISFMHATRSGHDRKLTLRRVDPVTYQGPKPVLIRGRWNVQIEAQDWRVLDSMTVH